MTNLTSNDIDAVCGLVDELCGIYWDESKAYLIESRLQGLVKQHDCANYEDLVRKVRSHVTPCIKQEVINAVTTNETLWFRDQSPYDALQYKLLPETIDLKAGTVASKRLRLWSAACSTGQEPYSLAITIAETIPNYQSWDIQILGTDISTATVEQASRGVYSDLEMGRGMTPDYLHKYFSPQGKDWKIKDEIRSLCCFKTCNLLNPYVGLDAFDIIFCRNVAIYFSPEDRSSVFHRLAEKLNPDGWIIAGSSESLYDLGQEWGPQQHCRANCYQPRKVTVTH